MKRKHIAALVTAAAVLVPVSAVAGVQAASASETPASTVGTALGAQPKPKLKGKPAISISRAEAPAKFGTKKYSQWYARQFMWAKYHWGPEQYRALVQLWEHESGWQHRNMNGGSGAYGIPQSLPGSKMASAGKDWRTNPETQIRWGLGYIKGRYGSPLRAWGHFQSSNWY